MKTVLYLGLFMLASVAFSSCGGGKENSIPNNIGYDSIIVSKTYTLENYPAPQPYCSLNIRYVFPSRYKDSDILKKIQKELNIAFLENESYGLLSQSEAINKYVADYIENYKQEMEMRHSRSDEAEDETEITFSFSKILTSNVLFDQEGLLVYQIKSMDCRSNADTLTLYRNIVIDMKTGNQLSEREIFIPNYEKPLNALIVDKILAQNNVMKTEDLFELGYWGIDDIASNNNFYVNKEGLTYIFNQGEYSALRLGDTRVFFPYKKISHLLKKDSPISALADN